VSPSRSSLVSVSSTDLVTRTRTLGDAPTSSSLGLEKESSTSVPLSRSLSLGASVKTGVSTEDMDAYALGEAGDVSMCTVSTSASMGGPLTPAKGQSLGSILPSSDSDLGLGLGMGMSSMGSIMGSISGGWGSTSSTQHGNRKRMGMIFGVNATLRDCVDKDPVPKEMDLGTDVGIVGLDDDDDSFSSGSSLRHNGDGEARLYSRRMGRIGQTLASTHMHTNGLDISQPSRCSPKSEFPIPVSSTSLMFPDLLADLNLRNKKTGDDFDEDVGTGTMPPSFSSSSSLIGEDQVSVLTCPVEKKGLALVSKGVDYGFGWMLRRRSNSQTQTRMRMHKEKSGRIGGREKENIPPLRLIGND
jgi:hypothetical protein